MNGNLVTLHGKYISKNGYHINAIQEKVADDRYKLASFKKYNLSWPAKKVFKQSGLIKLIWPPPKSIKWQTPHHIKMIFL